jgi:hypothetical protein
MDLIRYAQIKNLTLYTASLDASKAFDKVVRAILWSTLLDTKLPKKIIYIIIKYYENSLAFVDANGEISTTFLTILGVKQGGVISPRLFSLYIWIVICEIDKSNIGARLKKIVINVLLYADDIILVAFTKACLQKLLDIVGDIGSRREIKFNPEKSVIMIFENKKHKPCKKDAIENPLTLTNQPIPVVNSMRYLGLYINDNGDNKTHLDVKCDYALKRLSELSRIGIYSSEIHPIMKGQIYQTMIRPIILYGCEIANYNIGQSQRIRTIEAGMIKEILGIHKMCHSTDLFVALKIKDTKMLLKYNKCTLFNRLTKHKYICCLMESVIDSLPPPKKRILTTTSYFEELFKIIEIEYDYSAKKYAWNISLVREKCLKFIMKCERDFTEAKLSKNSNEIRRLFDQPQAVMIKKINALMLAVDFTPYQNNNDTEHEQSK